MNKKTHKSLFFTISTLQKNFLKKFFKTKFLARNLLPELLARALARLQKVLKVLIVSLVQQASLVRVLSLRVSEFLERLVRERLFSMLGGI